MDHLFQCRQPRAVTALLLRWWGQEGEEPMWPCLWIGGGGNQTSGPLQKRRAALVLEGGEGGGGKTDVLMQMTEEPFVG